MDTNTRQKIMDYKEDQLKKFKMALLMTGIAGGLVVGFCCYLMLVGVQLADAHKGLCENLYGLDVIVFSSAIGCVYAFINFNNLRKLDAKLNRDYFLEFRAQTERFLTSAQGIFVCLLFTFLYWLVYSLVLHITYYVDKAGVYHNMVFQNRIGLALMLIAVLFSIVCMHYGHNLKHRLGLSKEEMEEAKGRQKKKVRRS